MADVGTLSSLIWSVFTAALVLFIFAISKFLSHVWITFEEIVPEENSENINRFKLEMIIKLKEDLVECFVATLLILISLAILYEQHLLDEIIVLIIDVIAYVFTGVLIFLGYKIPERFEGKKFGPKLIWKVLMMIILLIPILWQIQIFVDN
jgi:hypothetical protein